MAYRRIGIEKLEGLVGRGVYYGAPITEAPGLVGQHVVVVGGGNSSGQASIYLSRYASRVTVVVRGAALDEMSEYLIRELESRPNIEVRTGTVLADAVGDRRLQAIVLRNRESGAEEQMPTSACFIQIGALPRTDWLPPEIQRDEGGYILTGDTVRQTADVAGESSSGGSAADSTGTGGGSANPLSAGASISRRR